MSEPDLQNIGGYPVEKPLSQGSYDVIYQVKTAAQPLAAKVLRPDLRSDGELADAVAAGWERCRATAHPGLATGYAAATDQVAGAYLLMELFPAQTLRKITLDGAKVAWRDAQELAEQILNALDALHAGGVCHGDLWPSNILISQDQDVKLEGAGGLSDVPRPLETIIPPAALSYHPPERICAAIGSREGRATPSGDLYALGFCLRFLLTGEDPFPGLRPENAAAAVLERKPTPAAALRSDLTEAANLFLLRLTAKNPAARYVSAKEALAELKALREGKQPTPPPAPPDEFTPPGIPVGHGATGGVMKAAGTTAVIPTSIMETQPVPPPTFVSPEASRTTSGSTSILTDLDATGTGKEDAVGEGRDATKFFGRLETQVGSTIPQSEEERRGDDLYRQGRLPLAMAAWKEARENGNDYAGLKAKIELGERELRKEAYHAAMDECRARLLAGDCAAAINRAYVALDSALEEHQRAEADRLLEKAKVAEREQAQKKLVRNLGLLGGSALVVILLIFAVPWSSGKTEKNSDGKTGQASVTALTPSVTTTIKLGENTAFTKLPKTWKSRRPETPFALYEWVSSPNRKRQIVVTVIPGPNHTDLETLYSQLQANPSLDGTKLLSTKDKFHVIDSKYRVAKLLFQYQRSDNGTGLYYRYVMEGPNNKLYMVNFLGPKEAFDAETQRRMRAMIRWWRYKSVKRKKTKQADETDGTE